MELKNHLSGLMDRLRPWTAVMNRIVGNFVEDRCAYLHAEDKEALRRWEQFVERIA